MQSLPEGLQAYRSTPVFTETTVPAGLLKDHETKAGIWGVIHIISGQLRYRIPSLGEDTVLSPEQDGIVIPQTPHSVAPLSAVEFYVAFWR